MFLLQVLENVFYVFAIVMLIGGILILISVIAIVMFAIMSAIVNGVKEDKENNNL
jgi:uncharacterized membrane protein HdeD (DUF308 family)